MTTIPVLVEDTPVMRAETLGVLEAQAVRTAVKEVDAEKLRKSLRGLVGQLSDIIKDDNIKMGSLHLSELEVHVEITAEGGIALVGTAKAGIKGAICLKFSR
ncbi:hypothetical protein JXA70_03425 [candidate division KSB1 bacterium]|nr:hypothetical protein [candidate division KSB1 bacterium]